MMKVKKTHWWRPVEFTVAEAVESECIIAGSDGELERMGERVQATANLISRLVEALHSAGALNDAAILHILGAGWEKVEVSDD